MLLERSEEEKTDARADGALPMSRARWSRRQRGAVTVLAGIGVLACVPFREQALESGLAYLALVALAACAVRVQRAQRLLLRLELIERESAAVAVARMEALMVEARGDAGLQACVLASIADIELRRRDQARGLGLYEGLGALGWSPRALLSVGHGSSATVIGSAATMACLEAAAGNLTEAEEVARVVRRGRPSAPATLLEAVLRLRRGQPRGAIEVIDRAPAVRRRPGPRRDLDALGTLRAFAAMQHGASPYREPSGAVPPRAPGWLTARWPALRRFDARLGG